MRNHIGSLLRDISAAIVLLAERIDPQPDTPDPCAWYVIHDDTNQATGATLGTVTWHRTG